MDTKTKPMVSVIIPSYNYGHFVREAIDSVQAQTYSHHEIIVVDDGSTDRTSEVVSQYPGVRFIRQHNRGASAARNRGIQESRGQYVVFLDADDRLLPQHFEISLEAFRSHPEVGWVCGEFQCFGTADPMWQHDHRDHRCERFPDLFGSLLRFNCTGAPHTKMYRRQVLVKIGGFDECFKSASCEDWELYFRLSREAPLYCHHQLVAEYRLTDQQASRRWHVMLKGDLRVIRAQWRFVRGHRLYEEAYYQGIANSRAVNGERALWQMVADARSGQWPRALQAFQVLLTCYPAGLVNLFKVKARKSFFIRKQGSL
jgi:glycosyltransferase involved in cell wall biosynthesis